MAKQAIVIIDERTVMPVALPAMSDYLAFDVKPFKLDIPAGWFDCTHLWSDQVYSLTLYVYDTTNVDVGIAGINKPATQILKWICSDPRKPIDVYGVAVLFNQDNDGNYVDFTVDEFMFLLAEVKHLERTSHLPPGYYSLATVRRRNQDSTTQSSSTSFFLTTTD